MAGSVLLIDDDVDVLRSIGNYFERLGYEVYYVEAHARTPSKLGG